MSRARIGGTLHLPYQDEEGNDIPIATGEVVYKMSSLVVDGRVVRVPATVIAEIKGGILQPKDLQFGVWTAEIRPFTPSGYTKRIKFLADKAEMDLSDVIPIPIDNMEVVKGDQGDTGLSAYEVARENGYQGTLAEWLQEVQGSTTGIAVNRVGEGRISVSGPSAAELRDGVIAVYSNLPVTAPAWSVNTLALMAGAPVTSLWHDEVEDAIYSGFGDWNANTHEVGVVRHHLATGRAEVLFFPDGEGQWDGFSSRRGAYTEAVEKYVRIGDSIYVPHIDGAGFWEGCGYITNEGGTWHEVKLPGTAIHVFDMAQTSEGIWAAGSGLFNAQQYSGAELWFRPNGGEWISRHRGASTIGGSKRFYKISVENDRACVRDDQLQGTVQCFNATDMIERGPVAGDNWRYRTTPTITVGSYKYTGHPAGKITKERIS